MTADVMVGSDVPLAVFDEKEGKAGLGDLHKVAGVHKPRLVGHDNPVLGKNGPSLQLVHGLGAIP
jgi:hypothetical protein